MFVSNPIRNGGSNPNKSGLDGLLSSNSGSKNDYSIDKLCDTANRRSRDFQQETRRRDQQLLIVIIIFLPTRTYEATQRHERSKTSH